MDTTIKCEHCRGNGRIGWMTCVTCNGYGKRYGPQCICPVCGSHCVIYGGGWRCGGLYCINTPSNLAPDVGPEPAWWSNGTKVFMDGDMWCATHADFINLQESNAGFGSHPQTAVDDLCAIRNQRKD